MNANVRLAGRVLSQGLEPLVVLVVFTTLQRFGLAAPSPWWALTGLSLTGSLLHQPAVQRRLSGGDPAGRMWLRAALELGGIAVLLNVAGWALVFPLVCLLVLARYQRMAGSVVWRPVAGVSVVVVAGSELAAALGWTPMMLPGSQAHACAAVLTVICAAGGRELTWRVQAQERAEATLRRSEERFRTLVQSATDVIITTDADGRFTYLSPAIERVMGHAPLDLIGKTYTDLIHVDDRPPADALDAEVHTGAAAERRAEVRLRHADGSWHWHEVVVRNLLTDPAVEAIVFNHRDVTERREFQERLAHDATHDGLTGLINRTAFLDRLERAIDNARRTGGLTAVLFVDLNGFKQVNDAWGHEAGDGLLVGVSRVLQDRVLGSDVVGRLGGDEFGVVLTVIDDPDPAVAVAARIINGLREPIAVAGRTVKAGASIGVAVWDPDCVDADELIRRADLAMYRAKRRKVDAWEVYRPELDDAAGATPTRDELSRAVGNDELRLQYQPIVSIDSGDLVGVEALVRWHHPTLGRLAPAAFIPLAEDFGLIDAVGERVLRSACEQVRRWQRRAGLSRRISLTVNLSPRQLSQDTPVDSVLAALRETGFDPHDLILDVTEDALTPGESTVARLSELNARGIRIALDDFGTGHSSLHSLLNMPVDILKLDRCFVHALNGTPEGAAVAQAAIRLGQVLNLDIVAEGIETSGQAAELNLLGCPTGQGFHYAWPLDPEAFDALLTAVGHGPWPPAPHLVGTHLAD